MVVFDEILVLVVVDFCEMWCGMWYIDLDYVVVYWVSVDVELFDMLFVIWLCLVQEIWIVLEIVYVVGLLICYMVVVVCVLWIDWWFGGIVLVVGLFL